MTTQVPPLSKDPSRKGRAGPPKLIRKKESVAGTRRLHCPDHPPLPLRLRRAMRGVPPHQSHAAKARLLRASDRLLPTGGEPEETHMSNDIIETAAAAGNFKTLASALRDADLVNTLKGAGPYTVFARSASRSAEASVLKF